MADLKIYNNGENKILFSAGDRIIRQPYEFGNAFQNRMGLNNYIEISGLNLSMLHTSTIYITARTGTYNQAVYNMQDSNFDNFSAQIETSGADHFKYLKNFIGGNNPANPLAYKKDGSSGIYHGVVINQNKVNAVIHNAAPFFYSTSEQTYDYPISKIWIGACRGTNGATPSHYANSDQKFNGFRFYSRNISEGESLYAYAHGLGSDPQLSVGLEINMYCNFAEILDFSAAQDGSDLRVGCRDYSGNNHHGEIMNLPAGTLQEQLDWANANLFVPFIS